MRAFIDGIWISMLIVSITWNFNCVTFGVRFEVLGVMSVLHFKIDEKKEEESGTTKTMLCDDRE